MKRFPSARSVLLACVAAGVIAMAIPVDDSSSSNHHAQSLRGAVATMGQIQDTVANNNATGNRTPVAPAKPRPNQAVPTPPRTNPVQPGTNNSAKPPGTSTPQQSNPSGTATPAPGNQPPAAGQATPAGPESWGYTRKTSKLRIHVIDGRTKQPLEGAEVVVIETEQRFRTDKNGDTPWFDAPIFRNPKYRPMVAELHGQLGVIAYKNGYRDSIHLGIRMHENIRQEATVWMYKIGPGDRRIEPVLYQEPYHHLWLIQLADKFRQQSQIGEGPERP
ncbi:hypothetical protein Heshes_12700 [Alicyclobacillus hesperidum]|uniref:Uncharacterized protein n=1 Tax=Alicyclobacillus hesperidum TaxID=89784 RepID=A0AA37U274_9BACL|nr:hypothetical protein [Alicyclobacillus hesperidum]GLV13586.1 hypothetical protein Heshes_12700 [Alicyclobacillus hesperidum]